MTIIPVCSEDISMIQRIRSRHVVMGLLLAMALCLHCSKDKSTKPADTTVQMTGQLQLDSSSGIPMDEVKVGFGANEAAVDTAGKFNIKGNSHTPGLAVARDANDDPLLLKIVPDPDNNQNMDLSVHSTALAIVFMNPFVCFADPEEATSILTRIEDLASFQQLEQRLDQKLQANPRALTSDDTELDALVSAVVLDYMNSYPEAIRRRFGDLPSATPNIPSQSLEAQPIIVPSVEKGGHQLTWESGNQFAISNSQCRWAYCTTPTDSFFIFPSGDLIDYVKKREQPWPPSKKTFMLNVTPGGDTARVNVYGYGFLLTESNSWHALSFDERNMCHWGGMLTGMFEFSRHIIGLVCQTYVGLNKAKLAEDDADEIKLLQLLLADATVAQRLTSYITANDPWGASYWLSKQFLLRLTTSADFRDAFYAVTGISITNTMLQTIGSWLAVPVKVVNTFNNVTQAFRAALAFNSTYFKTSFKVWKEYTDFGGVQGYVGDKTSGNAIQGVLVKLIGDDDNPMLPAHNYTTGQTGYYRFDNIGVGERSLQATKTGYKAATVGIVIEKNKVLEQDIRMEQQSGGVSGKVINEILQHHGVTPPYFADAVDITAREIGGDHRMATSYAYDGEYSLSLPTGNWWVVASHDDYKADSFQINVQQTGAITAPRDLLLKPDPSLTGEIWVDRDFNGSYEYHWNITFPQVGLRKPQVYEDDCSGRGNPLNVMVGAGVRGNSNADYDIVGIYITTDTISEAGDYPIGGSWPWGCSRLVPASVAFSTTRILCRYEEQIDSPMSFMFEGDPDMVGCDCGITAPGSLFLTDYGTELGDIVAGGFNIDLPGRNTCDCGKIDPDHWDVSCAKARVNVSFRFLVGTDYLLTFTPYPSSGMPSLLQEK
jgi:hypothetical protein